MYSETYNDKTYDTKLGWKRIHKLHEKNIKESEFRRARQRDLQDTISTLIKNGDLASLEKMDIIGTSLGMYYSFYNTSPSHVVKCMYKEACQCDHVHIMNAITKRYAGSGDTHVSDNVSSAAYDCIISEYSEYSIETRVAALQNFFQLKSELNLTSTLVRMIYAKGSSSLLHVVRMFLAMNGEDDLVDSIAKHIFENNYFLPKSMLRVWFTNPISNELDENLYRTYKVVY